MLSYFVQLFNIATEQMGCISFVLDFLVLFDQAKRTLKTL